MIFSENTMTPSERFWRLLKPDQSEIRNVYIYAVFNGLVYLSIPLGIQAIVNLIQVGQVSTSWIVLLFIVILGVTLTGILQISQLRITENLQQKIFTRAAFEFAYRIPRIKMEALYRHYAPELGRWPSRDPIEERGGINLYAFARNDGINGWDALGLLNP